MDSIAPHADKLEGRAAKGELVVGMCAQMLSQDLLQASLEIPFSVPPYMSLLARAVATLEGIALTGDPDYQMVTQAGDPSLCSLLHGSVMQERRQLPCCVRKGSTYDACLMALMRRPGPA